MITKTQSFQTSDGAIHASIDSAQAHELKVLLVQDTLKLMPEQQHEVARILVAYRDQVVDILTTGPRSKSKARAINGGTKKRKGKDAVTPAADLGLSK